jgi:hypothetical protein
MLKPLSLELVCGPTGPLELSINFPLAAWALLMGFIAHINILINFLEIFVVREGRQKPSNHRIA